MGNGNAKHLICAAAQLRIQLDHIQYRQEINFSFCLHVDGVGDLIREVWSDEKLRLTSIQMQRFIQIGDKVLDESNCINPN